MGSCLKLDDKTMGQDTIIIIIRMTADNYILTFPFELVLYMKFHSCSRNYLVTFASQSFHGSIIRHVCF